MKLILCFVMVLFFACDDGGTLDFESQGIMTIDYGTGTPCGGSVMNYNGAIYRNYDGGVAPLDANLQFIIEEKLGSYADLGVIYHSEVINGNLWLSVVTYDDALDYVKVINSQGQEIANYQAGLFPGDFASWNNGEIIFVANEGVMGNTNGSISMIKNDGSISSYANIGDVVHAIEVYDDKLIVLVNGSHQIKIFNLSEEGLLMPGMSIDTGQSSPREMVVLEGKVILLIGIQKMLKYLIYLPIK